jgi:hypothetical protein
MRQHRFIKQDKFYWSGMGFYKLQNYTRIINEQHEYNLKIEKEIIILISKQELYIT